MEFRYLLLKDAAKAVLSCLPGGGLAMDLITDLLPDISWKTRESKRIEARVWAEQLVVALIARETGKEPRGCLLRSDSLRSTGKAGRNRR